MEQEVDRRQTPSIENEDNGRVAAADLLIARRNCDCLAAKSSWPFFTHAAARPIPSLIDQRNQGPVNSFSARPMRRRPIRFSEKRPRDVGLAVNGAAMGEKTTARILG
jgi:hypothetical protein